jgi:pyrroloquinoline quinone biosynthesis protein B
MSVKAILLGVSQDGGVPQAGCYCSNCERARRDPAESQLVVCLGLVDHRTGQSWLIDATPDFREQLHTLRQFAPDCAFAGIILSHAHIGHYTGLIHLGPEVMNALGMPVYVTALMAEFLKEHAPWSQLVDQGHIKLHLVIPSCEIKLSPNLVLLPLSVLHRDEFPEREWLAAQGRGVGRMGEWWLLDKVEEDIFDSGR